MNKGTKIRTALRIIVSIYSAFCVHQVAIAQLGDMLGAPWLAIVCAFIIVVLGLIVDALTTYYNNDYTEEACIGTGITRQLKAEKSEDYIGDIFFTDVDEVAEEGDNDNESGDDNEQ